MRSLATAAETVAERMGRQAIAAEQARDAEVEAAGKAKTPMGKDYWVDAWRKRLRAEAARNIAEAVKEVT